MTLERLKNVAKRFWGRQLMLGSLLVATCTLSFFALVVPIAIRPTNFPLREGDVAQQDILAPYSLSFSSQILTEQSRKEAEQKIPPIYLPADPAIARRQIERLRISLSYINTVRLDTYANKEQKLSDLAALEDIQLSRDTAERILSLSDTRWQNTQQEALNVLEQVMRNTIRSEQVKESQASVLTLISFSVPQDQATIIYNLVTPFVTSNSLYSEEKTQQARQEANKAVKPVLRTFMSGESIVRRGQIITAANYEALQQYGLIQPENTFQDILGSAALVILLGTLTALYFYRRRSVYYDWRSLALIALTFLIFLFGARLVVPNRAIIPYVYPLAAFGLTIAMLYNLELSLILSVMLSILAAFNLSNSLDLTFYYLLPSLFGILILGKGMRVGNFFWAGAGIGAAGSAIILAFRLPNSVIDAVGLITLVGVAFLNGFATASLTLLLQFIYAQVLGLTTALQLLEISRPDQPLLQFILQNAPGSYQHSLQVAILAEQAAERIGADALLVRVGALYHDAGKALNPNFFIENQIPGKLNPHDDLDPAVSAQTIIQHVADGVMLAKKYRLPPRIQDFMREHHGTTVTRYQYTRAVQAIGNNPEFVNVDQFRYPGPRPRSRETALLMLADGCQARARAELPKNEVEIRAIVKKVFDYCQREGQLDDTKLTLRDLSIIADAFTLTLQNTYHPRIQYPELKSPNMPIDVEESR